jgi:hypothetical protein
MRIVIAASILFVTTAADASTARHAAAPRHDPARPQAGAVQGGGRIAHSEFHTDDNGRRGTFSLVLSTRATEARELTLPITLPAGQVITGMTLESGGQTMVATITANDDAHQAYDDVVAQMKDPALIEWKDARHVLLHVYPVIADGDATVAITFAAADTIEGHAKHLDLAHSWVATPWTSRTRVAVVDPNDPYAGYWPAHY